MKGFVKFVVRLAAVIGAVVLLFVAYLNRYGFPPFLKDYVIAQLAGKGIAARFESMRLDLFRGVLAEQAVIADAKAPQQPLAEIDELELRWSWRRLLHRQNGIDSIRIANATISVPMPADEEGEARFTAQDAFATFRFGRDGTIQVDQLTGVYCGIRLYVTGVLKPRTTPVENAAPAASAGAAQKPGSRPARLPFVTQAVRELNRLRVTSPPQIDVDFAIDLDKPLASRVTARLRGADMKYRGLNVDSAAIDVVMKDGAIDVRQFRLKLYDGEVKVDGRYDMAMGSFDIRLDSTTDPLALVTLIAPDKAEALRDLKVRGTPKITARYVLSADTGSLPQLEAQVETGWLRWHGVEFESINLSCVSHGPELTFTNAEVVTAEGRLVGHGQYHMESTDFAYEIDSTLDPSKLVPLLPPGLRRIVEPAHFNDTPPHIIATVTGDFVDPDAFAYDAQMSAEEWSYRGVPLKRASATLQLRRSQLDVQNLILVRPEGQLRGTLFADFNRHRVQFDINTTANPTRLAPLLGEKARRTMDNYQFGSNTVAQARGLIDFDHPGETAWSAAVANDAFATWRFKIAHVDAQLTFTNETLRIDGASNGFSWWKLTADRAQAKLNVADGKLTVENFDADFYGGKLHSDGQVVFGNPESTYQFNFNCESNDVLQLTRAMRTHEGRDITGTLVSKFELHGTSSDLDGLHGSGELTVSDGVLWEAPLFGIFSKILGNTKATDAKVEFRIAKQSIYVDAMQIETGAFSAKSHGRLGFDGALGFHVEAQFLKQWPGLNILGKILGEILKYRVGGTLENPSYEPVNLPMELLPHDS